MIEMESLAINFLAVVIGGRIYDSVAILSTIGFVVAAGLGIADNKQNGPCKMMSIVLTAVSCVGFIYSCFCWTD